MKTVLNRISSAFAAFAVMAAAAVFDAPIALTADAAGGCTGSHVTQWNGEAISGDGNYYLGSGVELSEEIAISNKVTLCLNGQTITAASGSRVFTIKNGGSLTICDCQNAGKIVGNNASVIYVENHGELTLQGGTIAGGAAKQGGGVYVSSGGTFTMSGGVISDNTVSGSGKTDGGGGGVFTVGTFIMNGGTVSGNKASHQGGGVFVSGGEFTMSGGVISGNTVTGSGDTDGGGGVYTAGTFKMSSNSKISDNKAESSFGGGVLVSGTNAQFTLENGTISGNVANYGGGIHVSSSGVVMMKGGTIGGGNTASGGAGVCLGTGSGVFTMTNGTITGNTSNYGGGVQMNGGTMTFDGPVTIKDNYRKNGKGSNVYLRETSKNAPTCFIITIGANFAPTAPIGVHIQPKIECHKDVITTQFAANDSEKDISEHFKNDDDGQEIVYEDNKIKLHVEHDYGEWTITKAPGLGTTGSAKRVCKNNSSHVETAVLPPLSDTSVWTKDPDKDEYTNETFGTVTPSQQTKPPANNDDDDDYTPASSDSQAIVYKDPPTGISLSLAPPVLAIAAIAAALIRRKK